MALEVLRHFPSSGSAAIGCWEHHHKVLQGRGVRQAAGCILWCCAGMRGRRICVFVCVYLLKHPHEAVSASPTFNRGTFGSAVVSSMLVMCCCSMCVVSAAWEGQCEVSGTVMDFHSERITTSECTNSKERGVRPSAKQTQSEHHLKCI